MFLKSYMPVILSLTALVACQDAAAATAPSTQTGLKFRLPQQAARFVTTIGTPDSSSGKVPAGYESWGFTDVTVAADAGFIGTTAYGQAAVNYYATDAKVDLTLTTYTSSLAGPTAHAHEAKSTIWPSSDGFITQSTLTLPKACGYVANASADAEAFFKLLSTSIYTWDLKAASDSHGANQAPCAVGGTGGSSGGSGNGGAFGDGGQWTAVCTWTDGGSVSITGSKTVSTQTCTYVYIYLS